MAARLDFTDLGAIPETAAPGGADFSDLGAVAESKPRSPSPLSADPFSDLGLPEPGPRRAMPQTIAQRAFTQERQARAMGLPTTAFEVSPSQALDRQLRGLALPSEQADREENREQAARKFGPTPKEISQTREALKAAAPPVTAELIRSLRQPSRDEKRELERAERLRSLTPYMRDAELVKLAEDYLTFAEADESFIGGLQKAISAEGGVAKAFPFIGALESTGAKMLRNEVLEKQRRGEQLSKVEQQMVNAMALARRRSEQHGGILEQAGQISAGSVPFAMELAATGPVYGGVRSVTARSLGPVASRLAAVGAQTGVQGVPRISDKYLDRMAPSWSVDKDTLRQTIDDQQADKNWAVELAKAGGDIYIENLSERTGRLLGIPFAKADELLGVKNAIGRVMRIGAIKTWMDKTGAKSVREGFDLAKRAMVYNGVPQEIGEEYLAAGLAALTGVDDQHNVMEPLSRGDLNGAMANFVQSMPFKETPAMAVSFGLIPASQQALELGVGGVQRAGRAIRERPLRKAIQEDIGTPEARRARRTEAYANDALELNRDLAELGTPETERTQDATRKPSTMEKTGETQASGVPPTGGAPGPTVPQPAGAGRGQTETEVPPQGVAPETPVAAEPTEAQKKAGNYPKGHVKWQGFDISIETARGETRSGTDKGGKEWSVTMPTDYGYIRRTEGADGDKVDVYFGPDPYRAQTVWVVDQIDPETGNFNEHKTFVGFSNQNEVERTYDLAFSDKSGPSRRGAITEMPVEQFKEWLKTGNTKKALAYKKTTTEKATGTATAAALLKKPTGEIALAEIEALPEGEINVMANAVLPAGVRRAGAKRGYQDDSIKWGTTQSPDLLPELQEKYNKALMEVAQSPSMANQFRLGWYAGAIEGIRGAQKSRGEIEQTVSTPTYDSMVREGYITPAKKGGEKREEEKEKGEDEVLTEPGRAPAARPETKPTPDRIRQIRIQNEGIQVVFPDKVHTDLFALHSRFAKMVRGEPRYPAEALQADIDRVAKAFGFKDQSETVKAAQSYREQVVNLAKQGIDSGKTTFEAPRYEPGETKPPKPATPEAKTETKEPSGETKPSPIKRDEEELTGEEKLQEEWWDKSLTTAGRADILKAAGVNLPPAVKWRHMSAENRKKVDYRRTSEFRLPEKKHEPAKGYTIYEKRDPTAPQGKRYIVAGPEEYGIKLTAKDGKWKKVASDLTKEEAFAKQQDLNEKVGLPRFELITPEDDTPIGKNDAGENLYQRKDGSVYRMRKDTGRPDFGGDLSPVEKAEPTRPLVDQQIRRLLMETDGPMTGQQKAAAVAKMAKERGISVKDMQERIELEIVRLADEIARNPSYTPEQKFRSMVGLYDRQPTLSARTSVSVANQAYSTPAPLGFAMSYATGVTPETEGYDATAGNGMLLMGMNLANSQGNELNDGRAENLKLLGVGTVTQKDATKFVPTRTFDVVHLNPPFDGIPSTTYNGYRIGRLEHLIALKALESMADEGTAMVILGAKREEGEIGKGAQWVFENYLYGHYHVVANFEVSGDLYAKQGAAWPVRILVIAARRQNPLGGELSPKGQVPRLNTWDEVWTTAERIRNEVAAKRESLGADETPGVSVSPSGEEPTPAEGGGISPAPVEPTEATGGGGVAGGTGGGQPGAGGTVPTGDAGFPPDRPSGEPTNSELPDVQSDERGDKTPPVEGGTKPNVEPPANAGSTGDSGSPKPGFGNVSGQAGVDRPANNLTDLSEEELSGMIDDVIAESKKPPATPPKLKPGQQPETPPKKAPSRLRFRKLGDEWLLVPPSMPSEAVTLSNAKDFDFFVSKLGGSEWDVIEQSSGVAVARHKNKAEAIAKANKAVTTFGSLNDFAAYIRSFTPPVEVIARLQQELAAIQDKEQPPKAGKSLKKGGKHIITGAEDWAKGLGKLFGSGTHMGSGGPGFDEKTYAAAKPFFLKGYNEFKAAGSSLKDFVRAVVAQFGDTVKPYLMRFIQEMQELQRGPKPPTQPPKAPPQLKATNYQDPYIPRSQADPFGTLTPKSLADGQHEALDKLVAKVGPIDEFVANRLNMELSELRNVMAAEQIDGVALAIDQIESGDALIIGDETGIGKGRQAAAMIRYAILSGKIPIFFTADAKLFSDMYGDLLDINTTVRPFILGTPAEASIVNSEGERIVRAPGLEVQRREIQTILDSGMEAAGYNCIFLTYYQVNQRNDRQLFLERLAERHPTIVILDEAHKAAGDSTSSTSAAFISGGTVIKSRRGEVTRTSFPGLLTRRGTQRGQGGVMYLSATYAKRPDNMPLYFRTALSRSAQSFEQIVKAMQKGGVALQQAVSEALAKAGQYVRRERDFSGVRYDMKDLGKDMPETDRSQLIEDVDSMTEVLSEIVLFSQRLRDAVKDAGGQSTAQTESQLDMTDFAAIVHNQVNQLLLAAKADQVVAEAVAAKKRGEKPVVALMYTMESFLENYTEENGIENGQRIQLRWNELLKYALSRCLRITEKQPDGTDVITTLNPAELDNYAPGLTRHYRQIQEMADAVPSQYPVSPIDFIIQKCKAQGVVMLELTGRQSGIEYTNFETGEGIYRKFRKANKNRIVNAFNFGDADGMLLNASGSTGLSAHASVKFRDQQPRHMAIAQAATDINVFVQTLGRIKRTGMLLKGKYEDGTPYGARYTHLILPVQAELRPAAMAARKMKSLNANTTADADAAVKIAVEDIMNKYGDRIVAEFLDANQDLQYRTRVYIDTKSDGSVEVPRDVARKFTGRMALLPDDVQKAAYEEILPAYRALLEQLKSQGEYDLEIIVHDDWDGTRQSDELLRQGTDESNYLTSSVRMQQWEIRDARHVPTGDEMRKQFTEHFGSREKAIADWQKFVDESDKSISKRLETAQRKLEAADSDVERANAQRHVDTLRAVQARWQGTKDALSAVMTNAGRVVEVSNTETGETFEGMLTGVAYPKEGRVSPSSFRFKFSVNQPGGTLYVTGSDLIGGDWAHDRSPKTPADFKGRTSDMRYTRWFVTGNPIMAYDATNGRGKMVRFRSRDGEIVTGLLMPSNWSPRNLVNDPRTELVDGQAAQVFLREYSNPSYNTFIPIEIESGLVRIIKDRRSRDTYIVTTPAARSTGGVIYLDPGVGRIAGTFTKVGNRMTATVDERSIPQLVDRIMAITSRRFRPVGEASALMPGVTASNQRRGGGQQGRGRASLAQTMFERAVSAVRAQQIVNAWRKEHPEAPEVQIVNRPDWTTPGADGRQYGFRGWWDGDRFITVNLAYLTSEDDLRAVLEHERVHPLLQTPEGLAAIDRAISEAIGQEKLADLQKRYLREANESEADYRRRIQEEWFAHLAEVKPPLWRRILSRIREWLAKFKLVKLTDDELGQAMLRALGRGARRTTNLGNAIITNGPQIIRIGGVQPAITAHHGTPHKVDRFTTERVGSGQGAQTYGWGLYFAENTAVSEEYARSLAREYTVDGVAIPMTSPLDPEAVAIGNIVKMGQKEAERYAGEVARQGYASGNESHARYWQDVERATISFRGKTVQHSANQYTVRLNVESDELLDWDNPPSDDLFDSMGREMASRVREYAGTDKSGRDVYGALEEIFSKERTFSSGDTAWSGSVRDMRAASEYLASIGIKGIRYADQGSRGENFEALPDGKTLTYAVVNTTTGDRVASGFETEEGAKDYASQLNQQYPKKRTYNYVIFNDEDIEITAENGTPVDPNILAAQQPGRASLTSEPVGGTPGTPGTPEDITDEIEQAIAELEEGGETAGVPTMVFGRRDVVQGRERLNRAAGAPFTASIMAQAGLQVQQQANGLYELTDRDTQQEDAGQRLLDLLRQSISEQNREDAPQSGNLGNLLNSIMENFTQDDLTAFSEDLKLKLYEVAQGERSHRGVLLAALAGYAKTVQYVARNVNAILSRTYSDALGGAQVEQVLDDTKAATEAELERLLNENKELRQQLDKLSDGKAVDVIRDVFAGGWHSRDDVKRKFKTYLKRRLNVDDAKADEAARAFEAAFEELFDKAAQRALAMIEKAMTAQDRQALGMGKRRGVWRAIQAAVRAGRFDKAWVLRRMAKQRKWHVPTPEELRQMRGLAEEITRLEQLPPERVRALSGQPKELARERARQKRVTSERVVQLKRQIETMWSKWTQPINLLPEGRGNLVNAIYEFVAANLLFKTGFLTRQTIDVLTQSVLHIPTRALAQAAAQHGGYKLGSNAFWADAQRIVGLSARQQIAALRPALSEFKAALKGSAEVKNVDRLLTGIGLFDRLQDKADALAANGHTAAAFALRILGWIRFSYRFASAMDNLQGVPQEWAEIRTQAYRQFRSNGMTPAEASQATDKIVPDLRGAFTWALGKAKQMLEASDLEVTPASLESAAWHLLKGEAYQRMKEAEMPADAFEARNKLLRSLTGWNESMAAASSPGGIAANIFKRLGELGKQAPILGLPIAAFARFGNAIGTMIDRGATLAGLGLFPSLFGATERNIDPATGIAGRGASPWYKTAEDRYQRKAEAAIGLAFQSLLVGLVLTGHIIVRNRWPRDPEEREIWEQNGWKPGTASLKLGDGREIPLSMTVGPLGYVRPGLAAAGAVVEQLEKQAKEQARLDAEAAKLGIPAAKAPGIGLPALMAVAGETAYASILGGRTASGLIGSLTDYGVPNPQKTVAAGVSPLVPGLPGLQEISRMAGITLDNRSATVFDFMFPLPTSGARKVNMLGDPVGTPDDLQRITQILTGGTYPGVVSEQAIRERAGYDALMASGYRPPSISPGKGYSIDGVYRQLNPGELNDYSALRGRYLKEELAPLGADATLQSAKAAYERANRRALNQIGVTLPSGRTAAAGVQAPTIRFPTLTLTSRGTSRLRMPRPRALRSRGRAIRRRSGTRRGGLRSRRSLSVRRTRIGPLGRRRTVRRTVTLY